MLRRTLSILSYWQRLIIMMEFHAIYPIFYFNGFAAPVFFASKEDAGANKGSCVLDNLIERTGLKVALSILNEPSPSIKPTNQLFVIKTWFSGILKLIRLVFMLFFNSTT